MPDARIKIGRGIYGGRWINFSALPDLRPTPVRTREAVFSMLAPLAAECGFIDLCAGSGIMGFEAASLGFLPVYLLDVSRAAVERLRENQQRLQAQVEIACLAASELAQLGLDTRRWILYADPPYRDGDFHARLLEALEDSPALAPGSLYVAESDRDTSPPAPAGWCVTKEKRYGRIRLYFFVKR